ncbi:Gfo/Idh/MocA family oxidoreductase, partial [Peribacillus psychrosaccharolyticus]|uniref:Gfo/Idh/MocA family oxidoreductase n=1 Tax=Peribacillus psychrosaccharolyticus TaxID=1407 RepID=UPI003D26666C
MKKIKTAIIGFGLSGSSFHAPFIENLEEFDLSAIVVRHVEAVREVRPNVPVYENLDILFANEPDIELIVISTPTPTHYEFAKQAILAGKHVIVEKPFVVSAEEGVELIELAKEYNVVLSVYQNRRWDGDFLTVQDIVQSGKLGRVHTVEMNWDRYRKEVRNRWKEKQAPGSGNFYDMAPH